MNQQADSHDFAILTFTVRGSIYALTIAEVLEVGALVDLTPIPDSSPEVLGVANRHGKLLPMLDLRCVLHGDNTPLTTSTLFIVAVYQQNYVGLVVENVEQVEYISADQVNGAALTGKYIRGIINHKDRIIHMIALEALWKAFLAHEIAG